MRNDSPKSTLRVYTNFVDTPDFFNLEEVGSDNLMDPIRTFVESEADIQAIWVLHYDNFNYLRSDPYSIFIPDI